MASDPHDVDQHGVDPEPTSSRDTDTDDTRIIRRAPLSNPSQPLSASADPPTSIIRRHPTGEIPTSDVDYSSRAKPVAVGPSRTPAADPKPAIATAVVSIVSGWATAVIATDLITGWWGTDLLFCIAVGFLAAISAAATIGGVIALLLRQRVGRLLIVVGSVVAMLIFTSLFIAGAKLPGLVYAMPLLPLASIGLALLPDTARWGRTG
ncbi:Uncharacterised protein [Mycolicibacterium vanbaalenii]|uniref:Uncharacterized protein n=1 Tax=Mycolicibacterium vanbaalenii TaxID=110539 RepID=A0A5S9R2D5_MYCVN|nr:hypothetical protein [Mycolicibacterium vanbaalenii]CAA0127847.1 Uncharacterised protein [Mycolicibacterium vanbaalenii]